MLRGEGRSGGIVSGHGAIRSSFAVPTDDEARGLKEAIRWLVPRRLRWVRVPQRASAAFYSGRSEVPLAHGPAFYFPIGKSALTCVNEGTMDDKSQEMKCWANGR